MIGIYKITNKLNGKSYIGQSIHCGKRLDEHYKGNDQLIDQVIQLEGIENFTIEILKTVDKQDLCYWEDYYIIKYNTIFPNGYNKKWNTDKKTRQNIQVEPIVEEKCIDDNNNDNIDNFSIYTTKDLVSNNSMITLAWILSKSEYDLCNLFTIYKIKKVNVIATHIKRDCNIDNKTVKKKIIKLKEYNILYDTDFGTYDINIKNLPNFPYLDILRINKNSTYGELTCKIFLYFTYNESTYFNNQITYSEIADFIGKTATTKMNRKIDQSMDDLQKLGYIKYKRIPSKNSRGLPINKFYIEDLLL